MAQQFGILSEVVSSGWFDSHKWQLLGGGGGGGGGGYPDMTMPVVQNTKP